MNSVSGELYCIDWQYCTDLYITFHNNSLADVFKEQTITISNWPVFKYCLNVFPLTVKCNETKNHKLFNCEIIFRSTTFSGYENTSAQATLQSSSPTCRIWMLIQLNLLCQRCCEPAQPCCGSESVATGVAEWTRTALARLWAADELCWFISWDIYFLGRWLGFSPWPTEL